MSVEEKVVEFTVYVRKEGRITVPREVRDALNIDEGNLVKCKVEKIRRGEGKRVK